MCWQFSRNIKPICYMEYYTLHYYIIPWKFTVNVSKIDSRTWFGAFGKIDQDINPRPPPSTSIFRPQDCSNFGADGSCCLAKKRVVDDRWIHWFLPVGVRLEVIVMIVIEIVRLVYFTDMYGDEINLLAKWIGSIGWSSEINLTHEVGYMQSNSVAGEVWCDGGLESGHYRTFLRRHTPHVLSLQVVLSFGHIGFSCGLW